MNFKQSWLCGLIAGLLILAGCAQQPKRTQRQKLQSDATSQYRSYQSVLKTQRKLKVGTMQHPDTNLSRAVIVANYLYLAQDNRDTNSLSDMLSAGIKDGHRTWLRFDATTSKKAAGIIATDTKDIVKYNLYHSKTPVEIRAVKS